MKNDKEEMLLTALERILTQAKFTSKIFPNAPGRGDLLSIIEIASEAIIQAEVSNVTVTPASFETEPDDYSEGESVP